MADLELLDDDCKGPSNTSPPRPPSPSSPPNALGPPVGTTCDIPLIGMADFPMGGATTKGAAITSPPILDTPSTRAGKPLMLDALPASELLDDAGWIAALTPLGLFFETLVRTFGSFGASTALGPVVPVLFELPLAPARFKGVSGVNVVCAGDGSELPFTLWTPATTEAAVAPDGARGALVEAELGGPATLLRLADEAAASFVVAVPEVFAVLEGTAPVEADRDKGIATGWLPAAAAAAAEMVGNAEEEPVATDAERGCDATETGAGTRFAVDALAGSSKEGGGKTGLDEAFPVPDGPPHPVRRRGVEPAAPLAALKACCTICC